MYAIRVRDRATLDVTFSGNLPAAEALRAVSQALALAEAGGIRRTLCHTVGLVAGPPLESLSIIFSTLSSRLGPGQRVAVLCSPAQIPVLRRAGRQARLGEEFALFTRSEDAEEWLAGKPSRRLSRTALRHLDPVEEAGTLPGESLTPGRLAG